MEQKSSKTKIEEYIISSEDLNKIMGGTAAYVTGWRKDEKTGETWMDIGYFSEDYPNG